VVSSVLLEIHPEHWPTAARPTLGAVENSDAFPSIVRRELAFLTDLYDFRIVREDRHQVEFQSPMTHVMAIFDPRGEVEVVVRLREATSAFAAINFGGQTGTASLTRLVQLIANDLRHEEPALRGDAAFFELVALERSRQAAEWTAYYSGKGPRPETGRLP
jgi:hypothetical protein